LTPEAPFLDPLFIAPGESARVHAIGMFTDQSTYDISLDVAWSSNNTNIVTVDTAGNVTAGDVLDTATITALKGTVIDSISVNVSTCGPEGICQS
jgi:trimeric autotransporter adhesin